MPMLPTSYSAILTVCWGQDKGLSGQEKPLIGADICGHRFKGKFI
jgi:hypothetical protein